MKIRAEPFFSMDILLAFTLLKKLDMERKIGGERERERKTTWGYRSVRRWIKIRVVAEKYETPNISKKSFSSTFPRKIRIAKGKLMVLYESVCWKNRFFPFSFAPTIIIFLCTSSRKFLNRSRLPAWSAFFFRL